MPPDEPLAAVRRPRGHDGADHLAAGSPAAGSPAAAPPRLDAGRLDADHPGSGQPAGASLLAGLDPEQRAAAQADGPLMIIAGPGTGKTRTLTHRIAYQIAERGIPAEHFLALTFTRRAAEEMRHRLASLLPERGGAPAAFRPEVLVTTFHGLALRLLGEHAERAGLPPGFRVADENARLEAAVRVAGSERGGRRLITALGSGHRSGGGETAEERPAGGPAGRTARGASGAAPGRRR